MLSNYYIEAAQGVLGSMLIDRQAAAEIIVSMQADDFLADDYRAIFSTAAALFNDGVEISPVTIGAKAGPEICQMCRELVMITPSSTVWPSYAKIVRDVAAIEHARPLVDAMQQAMAGTPALEDMQQQAEQLVGALGGSGQAKNIYTLTDLCTDFMAHIDEQPVYLDWGFDRLNRHLLCSGNEYIILGARPSVGKTAFALQVGHHFATKGKRVGFFSLETDPKSVLGRILTAQSYVPLSAIKHKKLSDRQVADLASASGALSRVPFDIIDAAGYTPERIRRDTIVRRLDVVIVDYIQLVCSTNRRLSEYDRISETSRALQIMAKELGVVVIGLSQLNRNTDAYTEPDLSDLRGSGQLEQDADAILLMYIPPDYELKTPEEKADQETLRRIKIAKNKEGLTGKLKFWFNGEIQRFAAEWPEFYANGAPEPMDTPDPNAKQMSLEDVKQCAAKNKAH